MNYLAHLYLSYHDEGLLAGNFIADSVKGNPAGRYPEKIVEGIIMHRLIDDFTDKHAATKEALELFRPGVGRYAPVLLDIVYDHLLADNWTDITDIAMTDFTESVHTKLGVNYPLYPERMQQFYNNMVKYNFLPDYGTLEGIEQTLIRLQMRAKTDVDFVAAIATMENEKGRLRDLFLYFFTQIQTELANKGYARL